MKYEAAVDDGFRIRYSTCNEDNSVELAFLDLGNAATVFCITGSTGRVLNLLTHEHAPRKLIALDANVAQNYLLEIKIAAIKRFTYHEYIEFLGLVASSRRRRLFATIAADLSANCREFWRKNVHRIDKGVLFQGRFERFYKLNGIAINLLFRSKLKKLRQCDTLESQQRLYRDEWDGWLWRLLLSIHSSDWMYKRVLKDPIFFESSSDDPMVRENYVRRITSNMALKTLVRENPMFSLLLSGNYDYVSPQHWPQNLRETNFELLKSRVGCIECVNAQTDDYFRELPARSIDSFSLADIGNCMPSSAYQQLIADVIRVGRHGARFVIRHSYGEQTIKTPEYLKRIRCFEGLQREMAEREHTYAYTFTLGEVL